MKNKQTHRSNTYTKFTPATYRDFIDAEIEKRVKDEEVNRKNLLGACKTAYKAVGRAVQRYSQKELDALREELMTHLEAAFYGTTDPGQAAQYWLSQMRGEKLTSSKGIIAQRDREITRADSEDSGRPKRRGIKRAPFAA